MERFVRITCEYDNGKEVNMEGIEGSVLYEPEDNELSFRSAGNGRINYNTFYMKRIVINGEMVKGNITCYC